MTMQEFVVLLGLYGEQSTAAALVRKLEVGDVRLTPVEMWRVLDDLVDRKLVERNRRNRLRFQLTKLGRTEVRWFLAVVKELVG